MFPRTVREAFLCEHFEVLSLKVDVALCGASVDHGWEVNERHKVLALAEAQTDQVRERIAGLLQDVVREMAGGADGIDVRFTTGDRTTVYCINIPQEHRGKLIGAQGKNITSLRNILAAMAGSNGFRAIIELVV
ncbi:putative RNA-binding protein [Bdellovibrio bacteriovorus HD100]|uniref:Putative RNA-binding protein n=1 Tax=Bdellovibrio bacteriovorus (strain ATCC 15356 / DSM 50701 / NCIMB 9529 / HD100) TaxID=264462 RepID=Q6MIW3_BDEBA|nr:putative RNA-binding protein [Bdellovibrio bacteriovorus HD100]